MKIIGLTFIGCTSLPVGGIVGTLVVLSPRKRTHGMLVYSSGFDVGEALPHSWCYQWRGLLLAVVSH
jgi:hypothetical protein